MHHEIDPATAADIGGLMVMIAFSYFIILIGFGIRAFLYGREVTLLWPWMLMSIFFFCGTSGYLTPIYQATFDAPLPPLFVFVEHFVLAALSLTYGLGQLIDALFADTFQKNTVLPKVARLEEI